ncbi:outer membrane protein assembly factor BamB family protein [Halostreptopolyspora alba]
MALEHVRTTLEETGAGPVEEMVPSMGGALAILDDGVVAMDPATGEQRWSYHLPGTEIAVGVTPLDTTAPDENPTQLVVLTYDTPSLLGSRGHTITLDALTGQEKHSAWHNTQDPPTDRVQLLTQNTWIVPRGNRTLEAFSLESGDSVWDYQAPQDCQIDMPTNNDTTSGVGTLQTQVITAWHCPQKEHAQVVSLDSTAGNKQWADTDVAANREELPRVWTMDATALADTGQPHAAQRITSGELEHYYDLLDENGQFTRALWDDVRELRRHIQHPAGAPPDTTDPPDIVVGHSDEIDYSLRLHIIDELLNQEVLDPEDVPDYLWQDTTDGKRHLIENRDGQIIPREPIEQAVAENDDQDN